MRLLAFFSIVFALAAGSSSGVAAASAKTPRPLLSGSAVIREMNEARQHPQAYANHLLALRDRFRGNILVLPGGTLMRTREGIGAIDEAIRFLQSARPLPAFVASPGMSRASAEHVADQADGSFGHAGSDGSDPAARLNRYGNWSGRWGENISYGKSSARDIVVALIVDDGLPGRKHRKNIFNPEFNFAGAAVGPHARYRTICDIDFAAGYAERRQLPSDRLLARN
jgi:uncharacterized protein YkwD